jgi:hypothetical protein
MPIKMSDKAASTRKQRSRVRGSTRGSAETLVDKKKRVASSKEIPEDQDPLTFDFGDDSSIEDSRSEVSSVKRKRSEEPEDSDGTVAKVQKVCHECGAK